MAKDGQNRAPLWRTWFIFLFLIGLVGLFAVIDMLVSETPGFLSPENFYIIGRQTAMVSLVAFGMTFVITAAQIDLSVGSIVALVGMVSSLALSRWGLDIFTASALGLMTGALVGLINGLLTTKLEIPSFLVTLAMMGIIRGIAQTITGTQSVVVYNSSFKALWGAGDIFGVPVSVLWVIAILAVSAVLYGYMKFGNHVKAVGGNLTAARFSGINTDRIIIGTLVLSGLFSAVAGLLMTARLGAGKPDVGAGMELDAIAAVILGGTSLFGGRGSIVKTLIGALIMGVISNGMIIAAKALPPELQSSSAYIQMIIKGLVILAAASMSRKR